MHQVLLYSFACLTINSMMLQPACIAYKDIIQKNAKYVVNVNTHRV